VAVVAWFELLVGIGMIGFWAVAVATAAVPEIGQGDRAIWFHILAEVVIGVVLIAGGVSLLIAGPDPWTRALAAAAAGGMSYSTINSPGYYARDGNWNVVAAFALLSLLGFVSIALLVVG
jgi:hypothetical protein